MGLFSLSEKKIKASIEKGFGSLEQVINEIKAACK
jgi:superoxide dismutase